MGTQTTPNFQQQTDLKSPNQQENITTTSSFDIERVDAIYEKSFDEWSEEEANYILAYQKEVAKSEEREKRREAEEERMRESAKATRSYWDAIHTEELRLKQQEAEGSIDWFLSQAQTKTCKFQSPRITSHTDKAQTFLEQSYKMEVERWGGTYTSDEFTQRAIRDVSAWAVNHKKPGMLLRGFVGVGKTTMLYAIAKLFSVVEKQNMKIVEARKIADMGKENKDDFIGLVNSPMLGIDDLGTEPLTIKSYGNEITPMVELLTERYNKRLFTIITTNLTKKIVNGKEIDELQEVYGERLYDRFKEMYNTIAYDSRQKSYRR